MVSTINIAVLKSIFVLKKAKSKIMMSNKETPLQITMAILNGIVLIAFLKVIIPTIKTQMPKALTI